MGVFSSLIFWRRKARIVPVVRLSGVIAAQQSLARRGLSLEAVEPQLKKAFSMKRAKAVVLLIVCTVIKQRIHQRCHDDLKFMTGAPDTSTF